MPLASLLGWDACSVINCIDINDHVFDFRRNVIAEKAVHVYPNQDF